MKIKIISLISLMGLIGFIGRAQQAPDFMLTWKANSFAPAGYHGKTLPTQGTLIEMSLELIDGGRLASLSPHQIRWYVNDKLQRSGLGVKIFTFTAAASPGNDQNVRAVIMNYRGRDLEKTIAIPVVNPEAVIEAPYPDLLIQSGANAFKAVPYFFNIANINQLTFRWSANNKTSEGLQENPEILNLNVEGGRIGDVVNIMVVVKNTLNELEFASQSLNVSVK